MIRTCIDFLWRIVAWIVTTPAIAAWLVNRAQRTPYFHIQNKDRTDVYMYRWWLFNPYPRDDEYEAWAKTWRSLLPSIRIHHIRRPDLDRALHDHPWNARTIVLHGWYEEERPENMFDQGESYRTYPDGMGFVEFREVYNRRVGYTGRLLFGQYHRISALSAGGVFTLFITFRKQGIWGFDVDGVKIPHREYRAFVAAQERAA